MEVDEVIPQTLKSSDAAQEPGSQNTPWYGRTQVILIRYAINIEFTSIIRFTGSKNTDLKLLKTSWVMKMRSID